MRRLLSGFITVAVLFAIGCSYHKADLIYPTSPVTACDTISTITYSNDVVNILNIHCYVCHSGNAAAGNGFILDTYAGVRFMANSGRLVRSIDHTGPPNTKMPQFGFKLSECNIAKIRTWVRKGALNN